MLVLTRREGEKIVIGGDITLTVVSIRGNKIRLGIAAPPDVAVRRSELIELEIGNVGSPFEELQGPTEGLSFGQT